MKIKSLKIIFGIVLLFSSIYSIESFSQQISVDSLDDRTGQDILTNLNDITIDISQDGELRVLRDPNANAGGSINARGGDAITINNAGILSATTVKASGGRTALNNGIIFNNDGQAVIQGTLDLGRPNNSSVVNLNAGSSLSATTLTVNNGHVVNFNGGTFSGLIRSNGRGTGTINFLQSTDLGSDATLGGDDASGTGNNRRIGLINFRTAGTIYNIDSNIFAGIIDSSTNSREKVLQINFGGDVDVNQLMLGANEINLAEGKTIRGLVQYAESQNINFTIGRNASVIGNIEFGSEGSRLFLEEGASVTGDVFSVFDSNTNSSAAGRVFINGARSSVGGNLGLDSNGDGGGLLELVIADNSSLLVDNNRVSSREIIIGKNSELTVGRLNRFVDNTGFGISIDGSQDGVGTLKLQEGSIGDFSHLSIGTTNRLAHVVFQGLSDEDQIYQNMNLNALEVTLASLENSTIPEYILENSTINGNLNIGNVDLISRSSDIEGNIIATNGSIVSLDGSTVGGSILSKRGGVETRPDVIITNQNTGNQTTIGGSVGAEGQEIGVLSLVNTNGQDPISLSVNSVNAINVVLEEGTRLEATNGDLIISDTSSGFVSNSRKGVDLGINSSIILSNGADLKSQDGSSVDMVARNGTRVIVRNTDSTDPSELNVDVTSGIISKISVDNAVLDINGDGVVRTEELRLAENDTENPAIVNVNSNQLVADKIDFDSNSRVNFNGNEAGGNSVELIGGIIGAADGRSSTLDLGFGSHRISVSQDPNFSQGSILNGSLFLSGNNNGNGNQGNNLETHIRSVGPGTRTESGSIIAENHLIITPGTNIGLVFEDNHAAYREAKTGVINDIAQGLGFETAISNDLDLYIVDQNGVRTEGGRIGLVDYRVFRDETGKILQRQATLDRTSSTIFNNNSTAGVFNAVDNTGDGVTGQLATLQTFLFATNGVTDAQRQDALESLNPNNIGLNQISYELLQNNIKVIESRLFAARLEDDQKILADRSNFAIKDKDGNDVKGLDKSATSQGNSRRFDAYNYDESLANSLWIQSISSTAHQENKGGFTGFDSRESAITIGYDRKFDNDIRAGVALTLADTNIKNSARTTNTDIDTYQINLYGEKVFRSDNVNLEYFIDGFISAARSNYESNRNIVIGNGGLLANADFDGDNYSAKAKAGLIRRFDNTKFTLSPDVSLLYSLNTIEDYVENGAGNAALQVTNDRSQLLEGEAGLSFGYEMIELPKVESFFNKNTFINFDNLRIHPEFRAAYAFDFIGNQQTSDSNFLGQSTTFNTVSSRANRRTLRFDLSLNIYASDHFSFTGVYLTERRTSFRSETGLLRLRYEW